MSVINGTYSFGGYGLAYTTNRTSHLSD